MEPLDLVVETVTYVTIHFSTANPPSMKRLSTASHHEPAQKRPPTPLEDKVVASEVKPRLGTTALFTSYIWFYCYSRLPVKLHHSVTFFLYDTHVNSQCFSILISIFLCI